MHRLCSSSKEGHVNCQGGSRSSRKAIVITVVKTAESRFVLEVLIRESMDLHVSEAKMPVWLPTQAYLSTVNHLIAVTLPSSQKYEVNFI
jgi:hypothetical protein